MAKQEGETDPLFTHLWMPTPAFTSFPVEDMYVQYFEYRDGQYVEVDASDFPEGGHLFSDGSCFSRGETRSGQSRVVCMSGQ
eukprot:4065192-Pyramimonas_sp.AAC.1